MKQLAFNKTNYILLAIGMAIIITGLILMSGSGSDENLFNPDIFSPRRIKLAPAVCFAGFIFIIFGIMYHKEEKDEDNTSASEGTNN